MYKFFHLYINFMTVVCSALEFKKLYFFSLFILDTLSFVLVIYRLIFVGFCLCHFSFYFCLFVCLYLTCFLFVPFPYYSGLYKWLSSSSFLIFFYLPFVSFFYLPILKSLNYLIWLIVLLIFRWSCFLCNVRLYNNILKSYSFVLNSRSFALSNICLVLIKVTNI